MTTIFHIVIPTAGLIALVAFLGGAIVLPLFDLSEERADRKREALR